MRILFIGTTITKLGGAERVLLDTLRSWPVETDSIHLVTFDKSDICRRIECPSKITRHIISLNRSWYYPQELHKAISGLRDLVKKINPDVIHARYVFLDVLAALACPEYPRVIRLHNGTIFPSSPFFHVELGFKGRLRYRNFMKILRHRRPAAYMAVSSFVASVSAKSLGVSAERIQIAHNGIDSVRFGGIEPKMIEGQDRELRVVCPSRFLACKRYDMLLSALAEAVKEVPIKLRLVGQGPLESTYRNLIKRLQIEDYVSIEPWVDDVRKLYEWADLLAMTSEGDAFPTVCLEAMACARAIVAWKGSAFPELVEQRKTGILVPQSDIIGLARALVELGKHRELLQAMGKAARDRVIEDFNLEKSARNQRNILLTAARV